MADTRPAQPAKSPAPKVTAPPALAPAAASGDPAVQHLLAAREVHDRNGDAGGVSAADAALAALGFA